MWRTLGQLFAGYYCTNLCLLNLVFSKSITKPWTTLILRTKQVQNRILQGNVYSTNYLVFCVPPLDLWLLRQIEADLKRSWFIHYIWRSCLITVQCSSLFFLIIYTKKFLDCDWLREMQFLGNTVHKKGNLVQKRVTNMTFWLANKQRNSLRANQMRRINGWFRVQFGINEHS